mmetsp:Transcript_16066/g.50362  ORF Transcript_16066/g.50362 Transcript_16066/m.50362 type:complete len:95 (+) Transcript_16066:1114-1398(+)
MESVNHPILGFILKHHLVEFRKRRNEYYSINIVEAMNPLLPLIPLTTNVDYHKFYVLYDEGLFNDPTCSHSGSQNVLVTGHISRGGYDIDFAEV